jgi:DNA-binding transcriptional LysR family regulator
MLAQHGVPGLHIAPPPVLANVLPPAPQNYREKYPADIDVTNGQYAALLAAQDPESPVQPAAMLQIEVLGSSPSFFQTHLASPELVRNLGLYSSQS